VKGERKYKEKRSKSKPEVQKSTKREVTKGKGTNLCSRERQTPPVHKKHVKKKGKDIVTKVKTCTFKTPQNSTTIQG
jgi:hypothetical protein